MSARRVTVASLLPEVPFVTDGAALDATPLDAAVDSSGVHDPPVDAGA